MTSGGRKHRVLLWGGTAFNFGRDLGRLASYIAATQRMAKLADEEGIDVLISNHPAYDGSLEKLEKARQQPAENPFVIGTPAVKRALTVMGECAQAQRDRFLMQPWTGLPSDQERAEQLAEADDDILALMHFTASDVFEAGAKLVAESGLAH